MTDPNVHNLERIFSKFRSEFVFRSAIRIGSGHINDTYCITTQNQAASFILQKINSSVFKNIPGLMKNIEIVTHHLENKILSAGPETGSFSVLRLIPAMQQNTFYTDEEGGYWRLYNFVEGTRSFDVVENPVMAYKGGKAFGHFQHLTSDISAETLAETIPFFHNADKRLESYHQIIRNDPENRVKHLRREIAFIETRENEMRTIQRLFDEKSLPLRVTHNDTKFNNILFDMQGNAVCIVDLDTVMAGTVLYDFGDAIRTGANKAAEDEKDLSKIGINLELFRAYTRGYLESAGHFLLPVEIVNLALSAKVMTYLIGLRFLTDHIDGDQYYRINFPGHNLQRARSQFRLLETMEENFEEMKNIVTSLAKKT
jgi:hypothetical protein